MGHPLGYYTATKSSAHDVGGKQSRWYSKKKQKSDAFKEQFTRAIMLDVGHGPVKFTTNFTPRGNDTQV